MNRRLLMTGIVVFCTGMALAQRSDLSGLKFCIDPGHGGHSDDDRNVQPDPGVNFWESESNFEKALLLRQLLQDKGATVILTRTSNDTTYPGGADEPSLTARWQLANANNVDWFHSIHSNAFNGVANYTLVLLREDTAGHKAAFPGALALSNIMSPLIRGQLRTTSSIVALDYDFEGFFLGVLSGLVMPGELSEGSFHDVPAETRRLLNNDYHKLEAYAIRNAFMQYFGVPADTRGIIAGIQTDLAGGLPVNNTRVRLLPQNRLYNGDSFKNGFYMFDSLAPGSYTVRFETPGYKTDSVNVTVSAGATSFADRPLESTGFPVVVSTVPVNNDTAFLPTLPLRISFSTRMDTATVRAAFSITPPVAGSLTWDPTSTVLSYSAAGHFPFLVDFTVKVDTNARSQSGGAFDGTGSGVPGSPFLLHFRTRLVRVDPPRILYRYPDSAMSVATNGHCVNISFDEPLDPATVVISNFVMGKTGGGGVARTLQYFEANGKGGVSIFPSAPLDPGGSYLVRVSGVKDPSGNSIPNTSPVIWSFSVGPSARIIAAIDSIDASPLRWKQPLAAQFTAGVDTAAFSFAPGAAYPGLPGDLGAGALFYRWDTAAGPWLLRTQVDSVSPQKSLLMQKLGTVLEAYVLGDGGNSQFRFVVEDSIDIYPAGRPQNHKVSGWYPLNWVGWRLVDWDLAGDTLGQWFGGPTLGGQIRLDGFQLRYIPLKSAPSGTIAVDQFQASRVLLVSIPPAPGILPDHFALDQNFPNPFNPSTVIGYRLPAEARVSLIVYDLLGRKVATLVDALVAAGSHAARWDASECGSGVYFARFTASDPSGGVRFVKTTKLQLLK